MSELAVAVFAASRDQHLLDAPRDARFRIFRAAFDEGEYLASLAARGFRWLPRRDPAFPPLLAAVHDPPLGLFVRGEAPLELLCRPAVAIVGARACTGYGTHVARSFARELAAAGVVVVSGLARGIDGAAHYGALDGVGATVAVLGCGIDRDYPRSHTALAGRIAASGLIVSEYAPGVEPAPWRFPARNRIVAGLCAATLVVEARERSGALITADLALDEGREVLAVPGEITSALSHGANALLRLGATPATCPGDVLQALGLEPPPPPEGPSVAELPVQARAVLAAVSAGATTHDALVRSTSLDAGAIAGALVELELAGVVVVAGGLIRGVVPQT